jgi:hypothetical protein
MKIRFLFQSVFLFLTVAAQVAGGGHFADENGSEQVIETTDSHPFWVVNKDAWGEAKDLREVDVFIGANGELTTLTATARINYPDGITVYNFTVADNHNYFVVASLEAYENGASVVLVHNATYGTNFPAWIKHSTYNEIRDTLGQNAAKSFIKAMKKGEVPPNGHQGIKKLKGEEFIRNGVVYTHEIKILGQLGDYRVFGRIDSRTDGYIFDWFRNGSHR